MGIDIHNLNLLAHAQDLGVAFDRTIAIGRQALFIEDWELEQHRRLRGRPPLSEPPRSGAAPRYFEPLMQQWLGAALADSVDASPYENARLIHDMNLPWPDTGDHAQARGRYDAVLDFGCLEHVFNFPVAWRNCIELCRVGGHVLHSLPANNLSGHGFYQFSPELFFNLYRPENGFELRGLWFALKAERRHWWEVANPIDVKRRVNLCNSHEVYMLVLARKLGEVGPLPAPQQSDYAQAEWVHGPAAAAGAASAAGGRRALVDTLVKLGLIDAVRALRERLRVLLLCDPLDSAGGVERFVCALANHLSQHGMEVAIGSADTPPAAIRYPLRPDVRVLAGAPAHTVPRGEGGGRLTRLARLARAQWQIGAALAGLVRRERPDVVVLNGLTTACSTLLMHPPMAARTICCDHNHFDARSRPWRLLRRRLYPRVAAVVSLTDADARRFRALNPRTQVIRNASTLHADAPSAPRQPLVLAAGRHVAQKGFDLLVRAWAAVVAQLPDARLRVLGDGPLREATIAQADALGLQGGIAWLPATAGIERHFREAAVFVLPSRYEGMPLVLLEAQAMGVPAVAFDCPTGPAEIVTDTTGRLVPAGDVDALARALLELLRSPPLREAMGRAAIARSREHFSERAHFERWTALVREVGQGGKVAA